MDLPWTVFAYGTATTDTEEWLVEQRAMSSVGYRGMADCATEAEAAVEARALLARLGAEAPGVAWSAAWCGPKTITGANEHHLGSCRVIQWAEDDDGKAAG